MIDSVPFFRPSIGPDEIEAVTATLRSGWLTSGPNVRAFEEEFSGIFAKNASDISLHSIAVNSATAALHLALEAVGVGAGDEVILPTLTFTATAEVVRYLGANPVFVDIDPETLCLDFDAVERAISPATKVIMPVHFAGRPCDMTRAREIADHHQLFIVDDAAHALPAFHQGRAIGDTFADATAFSFYANKTMTTGEGGMLVTKSDEIAARVRTMRLHGIDRDVFNRFSDTKASWSYDVVAPGFKYNLTDLAASLGRVQLGRLVEFRAKRLLLAGRYMKRLADLPLILPPDASEGDLHSWHLFLIQLSENAPLSRSELVKFLQSRNIGHSVHYRPLHQMSYWSGLSSGDFPAADAYFDRCLSLPLFMDMRDDELDYVIDALHQALGQ